MKVFLSVCLAIVVFQSRAQTTPMRYYLQAYNLKSKEFRGVLTEATDSSMTVRWDKSSHILSYSELKNIKVFRLKKNPFYYYPSTVGFGFILSSPFQSSWSNGFKTAGIGAGIIILSAAAETTFRKTIENINVAQTKNMKLALDKYVLNASSH